MGGKSPLIVLRDAEPQQAAMGATKGIFFNQGQVCTAGSRIYAHRSVFDRVVEGLAFNAEVMKIGSGFDPTTQLGPVASKRHFERVMSHIESARQEGATVLTGGNRSGNTGYFVQPTVLVDVTPGMRVMREEVFGPVMTVLRVPRDDDAAAVAMANSTAYGLGATVFSRSPARANAVAAALRCGMVGVNAFGLNYLVQDLPFGGVGDSGFGRFSGPEGLRALTLERAVVTDLSSAFSVPTPVPRPLCYPTAPEAAAFTDGLIHFQFAASLAGRARGLARMAGLDC
jgi:phenylacetaldehyde dehydrogenase